MNTNLAMSKVPEVTLGFWIIKIAATTLGETGGDTVTMTLNWGYLAGTALFLGAADRAGRRANPRQDVQPVSLLGDDRRLDHLRHDDGRFRRPVARDRLHRRLVAAARLPDRRARRLVRSEGTISVNTVSTPKVETFYWAAITFSQTLGTALGDWMADTGGLGYGGGALVFAAGLAVIVGLYFWTDVSRVLLFWAAFILTRPLGATVGDFLDKPVTRRRPRAEPAAGLGGHRRFHPGLHPAHPAEGRRASGNTRQRLDRTGFCFAPPGAIV